MSDDIKKLSDKIAELERQIVVLKQVAFEGPKTNLAEIKKLWKENEILKYAYLEKAYNYTDAEIYGEDYAKQQAEEALRKLLEAQP